MWRAGGRERRTANLCNEFMVLELQRRRKQLERSGAERKALVYHTAIANIQKYPLPIICQQQLKHLHGVGEQLSGELTSIIRTHYRTFLRPSPKKDPSLSNEVETEPYESNSQPYVRSNSVNANKESLNDDSRSCKSFSVNSRRPYKPRPKTIAANILTILKDLARDEPLGQSHLKNHLKGQCNQTLSTKALALTVNNLVNGGFIQFELQSDPESDIRLTVKGLSQASSLESKTKMKQSQLKIKGALSSFMEKRNQKIPCPEEPQENHFWRKRIPADSTCQIALLVDNRQVKDKEEQCFFQNRLREKHNLRSDRLNLPLGDFMWLYNGHVLDCIVERKKADDLVSSLHDGRYREQKNRLKRSGFTNIIYLFEGNLTGANARSEREVESALLNTRIRDGLRVVRVNSITESAKFICYLTESLRQSVQKDREIQTLGLYEEYAVTRAKSSQMTVSSFLGMSLKTIPGVGTASVVEVTKYFNSWGAMFRQLSQLNCYEERVAFMKELLRGAGVRLEVPELLVGLIFGEKKEDKN